MKTIAAADGTLPAFAKALASAGSVVDALCVAGRRLNVPAVVPLILLVVGGWRGRLPQAWWKVRERQRLSLPSSAGAVHALYLYGVHLVAAL